MSNNIQVQTQEPAIQTGSPVIQTQEPAIQTGSPVIQTQEPAIQTGSPVIQTGSPVIQTGSPVIQTGSPAIQIPTIQSLSTQTTAILSTRNSLDRELINSDITPTQQLDNNITPTQQLDNSIPNSFRNPNCSTKCSPNLNVEECTYSNYPGNNCYLQCTTHNYSTDETCNGCGVNYKLESCINTNEQDNVDYVKLNYNTSELPSNIYSFGNQVGDVNNTNLNAGYLNDYIPNLERNILQTPILQQDEVVNNDVGLIESSNSIPLPNNVASVSYKDNIPMKHPDEQLERIIPTPDLYSNEPDYFKHIGKFLEKTGFEMDIRVRYPNDKPVSKMSIEPIQKKQVVIKEVPIKQVIEPKNIINKIDESLKEELVELKNNLKDVQDKVNNFNIIKKEQELETSIWGRLMSLF